MNQLIKIETKTIGSEEINSINARELHTFLEVETRFNDWINRRIEEFDFINNIDYLKMSNSDYGGRNRIDYHLSVDMAKSVCIIERNDKGKQLLKEIASKSVLTLNEMMNFAKNIDIDDAEMFIYAIMEEDTGNIKIGISKNPEQRLRQLQTGNSSQLSIVKTIKADNNFKDEKALHLKNKEHLIRGEWFSEKVAL